MAPMVMPELWSESAYWVVNITNSHLNKYGHLINWKENESILEFGFADGNNSSRSLGLLLPEDYKEFIASDISLDMVEHAQKNCKIPRTKIVQMDIASTIPSEFIERFDHVFGFLVIHMVKNPRKAFENIFNMLKPGGTMFLNFFEHIPCDDIFDRLSQHPKWGKYGQEDMISPYFYNKNPQESYKQDLDAIGFKDYSFGVEKASHIFPNEEECHAIFKSVNGNTPKIPREEIEEYLGDYLKEIDRGHCFEITYKNGKKNIRMNFTTFVVVATK